MIKYDPAKAVRRGNAAQLSKLLELEPATPDAWAGRDLPAMLRHQYAASLEFDLGSPKLARRAAWSRKLLLGDAAGGGIRCFADLLCHPEPPLELLKLSKEFFKARTRLCKKSSPEWKVAYLFYLLSIVVAGERASLLSKLSPADLLKGIGWAVKQGWVDERTRKLVLSARKRLLA